MKLTKLQQATSDHIFDVFKRTENPRKCYLLADEVGLGKTIITEDVITSLEKKQNNKKPFVVYYICGNERIAGQNIEKLGGSDSENIRLSRQFQKRKNYKDKSRLVLPLTPAITFTNANSEFEEEEYESQQLFLNDDGSIQSFIDHIQRLDKESIITYNDVKDYLLDKTKAKAEHKRLFVEIRRYIIELTINDSILGPDMLIFDEFQNFSKLLYQRTLYPLVEKCIEKSSYVLLLSATPYSLLPEEIRKMNEKPFCDGTGLTVDTNTLVDEDADENRDFKEENDNIAVSDAFNRLVDTINGINKQTDQKSLEPDYLYENVFCRSERSMFYEIDKEAEVQYIYGNEEQYKKHIGYVDGLIKKYNSKCSEKTLKQYIAFSKEAPEFLQFATRYKLLKGQMNDYEFYKKYKTSLECGANDPYNHFGLNLVNSQVNTDKIASMLWIPPVIFNPGEHDNSDNPFWANKDYTKTIIFGNYRLSTASSSFYLGKIINDQQKEIEKNIQFIEITECDKTAIKGYINEIVRTVMEQEQYRNCNGVEEALSNLITSYLFSKWKLIVATVLDYKKPDSLEVVDAIKTYCAMGDLKGVIDEYVYLLLGENPDEKKICASVDHLKKMDEYFRLDSNHTAVICFNKDGLAVTNDEELRNQSKVYCDFAERFTDDQTDTASHKKVHQETLRHLFNAPFYPFVLSSTSVAQEGLDFHNYCHRIVHWSVPLTPTAYEQREGRIDRYLSHLIRKRMAICCEDDDLTGGFKTLVTTCANRGNGNALYPYWYIDKPNKEINNWPLFIRVVCAIPNSKEWTYFNRLRTALMDYNYYLGPTYNENRANKNYCPLMRLKVNEEELQDLTKFLEGRID